MDGLECSEIRKNELERTLRIDSEFYSKEALLSTLLICRRDNVPLTKFVDISDGNHAGISEYFVDEGVPYYRGQDAGAFFIESSAPICIDKVTFNLPVMRRSHLKKNDVLLSIVGTIGSLSLVYSDRNATCSCKLAILRPKEDSTAELLAVLLSSKYGQLQIKRFTRGAIQKGLILEDMDQLVLPCFESKFRNKIRSIVVAAFNNHENAVKSYEMAEDFCCKQLNIDALSTRHDSISEKGLSESFGKTGRLDAEYYQPKYDEYQSLIQNYINGYTLVGEKFNPISNKCDRDQDAYWYVEIGDINVGTATATPNLINTEDLPDNAKIISQKGDILVSTVRPNRGAVAILEEDNLLVSGAFTVLRECSNYKKEVLQVLLRLPLYRDWLLRYNVGTSYPVIKDEDVLNMPIPLLEDEIQKKVAAKVQKSFALRRQSKQLLEYAKQAVEMAIEQVEDSALEWLKDKVSDLEV